MNGDRCGKCVNVGNCSLADRRETIRVAPGQDFNCSECGKGLVAVPSTTPTRTGQKQALTAIGAVLAVGLAGALLLLMRSCPSLPIPHWPFPPTKPILRLGGSNTIGAKLAPELVSAYFRGQGCADPTIVTTAPDEMTVSCEANGKRLLATVAAHGSATAFQDLDDGDVDIGMASRKIKPEEVSKLSRFGDMTSPANERVLGLDGIAVLVNPANSVSSLTIDQVAAIFSGVVTDWRQVGGAAGPIHVYARDDKSGTYDTFKALVLNKTPLISTAQRIEDSSELSGKVAADPGGIGFVGLGAIGAAKPLAVSANGAAPLVPNRFTVATEDYVLSRRLFLYVTKAADQPDVLRFLEFANSPKGQAIVDEVGFVPLTIVQQKTVAPTSAPPEYEALTTGALRLSVNFRFNSGSSNLDNRALADLDRITAFLASSGVSPDRLVLVGFADSRGSGPVNQRLSEQRAQTVATMLAQRGISPGTIRGFGAALPVADNSTPDGREKNRRVEAWIRH